MVPFLGPQALPSDLGVLNDSEFPVSNIMNHSLEKLQKEKKKSLDNYLLSVSDQTGCRGYECLGAAALNSLTDQSNNAPWSQTDLWRRALGTTER